MSGIDQDLGELVDLEELDAAFIQEWEELKKQLRDLKEEQARPILVPVLKDTENIQ